MIFLAKYPVRFQRQKIIDRFIVDFYCHKNKLVIEIDGSQHYTDEKKEYDRKKTKILNDCGLKVMRFSNLDVDTNFDGVCQMIDTEITR